MARLCDCFTRTVVPLLGGKQRDSLLRLFDQTHANIRTYVVVAFGCEEDPARFRVCIGFTAGVVGVVSVTVTTTTALTDWIVPWSAPVAVVCMLLSVYPHPTPCPSLDKYPHVQRCLASFFGHVKRYIPYVQGRHTPPRHTHPSPV